jgi:hypothetical protein
VFELAYFILFLWSIVCLLYALIKQDQNAIQVFLILAAMLYITVSDIINFSSYVIYSPILNTLYGKW